MSEGTAKKKSPQKWAAAKAKARARMGGHSARAMQLATKYYKDAGGTYEGKKSKSNKLTKWGKEKWQTKDGPGDRAKRSDGSTKRYLPSKAWKSMSKSEREATDQKKRSQSKGHGVNHQVPNTKAAAAAGRRARNDG